MHERHKLEKEFEAFFARCDDVTTDAAPLAEALRRERRISKRSLTLSDSLWLIELLEHELVLSDSEILKPEADDQAAHGSIKRKAGDVRRCLVKLFSIGCRNVKDLAERLDTIHRLAPAFCECLHVSLEGSTRRPEEWEEFFLEPTRLAAEETRSTNPDADLLAATARHYPRVFSLERAFRVERATTSSDVIKAMFEWPSSRQSKRAKMGEYLRAFFFRAFRELLPTEQGVALAPLREAVFEELVPPQEYFEPINY